jgi:hypothetical protein
MNENILCVTCSQHHVAVTLLIITNIIETLKLYNVDHSPRMRKLLESFNLALNIYLDEHKNNLGDDPHINVDHLIKENTFEL